MNVRLKGSPSSSSLIFVFRFINILQIRFLQVCASQKHLISLKIAWLWTRPPSPPFLVPGTIYLIYVLLSGTKKPQPISCILALKTGKFLLAARKHRNGLHSEYIISDDVSQGSNAYVGKLRSNFFGTKYTIDDRHNIAKQSNKQISPEVPAGSSEVGRVAYKLNLAKKRGPRKMVCSLNMNETLLHDSKTEFMNKVPRWHEALKCWCLNFHGRVTRASVKNFQVVAVDKDGDEKVLLQFGRVGADTFTMDYGEPFSVFQAFAICLTTFGPKFGCE